MAIGSAFAAGYNTQNRKQQRSLMPAINTLSSIIERRKRGRGRGMTRVAGRIQNAEDRADAFFAEKKLEEDERYARYQLEEGQRKADEKEARNTSLMQAEEGRRQEAHQLEMQKQQAAMGQQEETFERESRVADRSEAYELVKQGLMMRDAKTVNAAMQMLIPEDMRGEDVITEGETVEGARSFKGRPAPAQGRVPQFIFDPDSDVVGVIFPGQEKPTVFKNPEQAFKNVLAPMNPRHEKSTKEQVTHAKNVREAEFKEKKLRADVHDKAHEAAMQQFEADGYYQPAMYNKEDYEDAYRSYVSRATGQDPNQVEKPPEPTSEQKKAKAMPEGTYTGDEPPKGYPNARRAKNGAWYVKRGDSWAPILTGKGKKAKKPKAKPKLQLKPKSSISAAGVNFPPKRSKMQPRGGFVSTAPPYR